MSEEGCKSPRNRRKKERGFYVPPALQGERKSKSSRGSQKGSRSKPKVEDMDGYDRSPFKRSSGAPEARGRNANRGSSFRSEKRRLKYYEEEEEDDYYREHRLKREAQRVARKAARSAKPRPQSAESAHAPKKSPQTQPQPFVKPDKETMFKLFDQYAEQEVATEQKQNDHVEEKHMREPKKLSPHQALYQKVKTLEQKHDPCDDSRDARKVRTQLRDAYVSLALNFPQYAQAKKVEHKLWMLHYKQIDPLIRAVRREPKSGLLSRLEVPLKATLSFYSQYVKQLKRLLVKQNQEKKQEEKELSSTSSELESSGSQDSAKVHRVDQSRYVEQLLCSSYCALGDLERYHQMYVGSRNDFQVSIENYTRALKVIPGHGKAHNQLAVIASHVKDRFTALYEYIRSLHATNGFPARENLVMLFDANRRSMERAVGRASQPRNEYCEYSRSGPVTRAAAAGGVSAYQLFIMRFTAIQSMLYQRVAMECFDQLLSQTMLDFDYLIGSELVDEVLMLKLAVLCIHSVLTNFMKNGKIEGLLFQSVELTNHTESAMFLMFDIFGTAVECLNDNLETLKFLAPVSMVLLWLTKNVNLCKIDNEKCHFFRSGLAKLVNSVNELSNEGISKKPRKDACDLEEISGFKPIQELDEWKDFSSHDSHWQLDRVRSASSLLNYSEETGKYTAWSDIETSADEVSDSDSDLDDLDSDEEILFEPFGHRKQDKSEEPDEPVRPSLVPSSRDQVREQEEKRLAAELEFLSQQPRSMPLVVLDAPNISMRHGNHKLFSTKGLELSVEYWKSQDFKVVAFIPDFYLEYDTIAGKKRLKDLGIKDNRGKDIRASQLPDSVTNLNKLKADNILFTTPSSDYDDSYCIKYAQNHNGFIVSNDRFRDAVKAAPPKKRAGFSQWLRSHVITYTFVNDEFLPNPDFVFPQGRG